MESLPMNQNNFGKTMSSREIAELTGKEHKHVMRDIRSLINQGAISEPNFRLAEYTDTKGEKRPMYLLDFNTTMTLLGRYGMSYLKAKKALVNHGLTENNAMTTSIVSTPNHSNFGKSMSSREIAELTGKLHFNIMRDIKTLIGQGAFNGFKFEAVEYTDAKGEKRPEYLLNFDATMTLLIRYGMTYDAAKESLSKRGFKEKAIMENAIVKKSFKFNSVKIRTAIIDGEPWFVAKDVCDVLGYKDTVNAVKQHCRGVAKHHPIIDALGRKQEVRLIAEPDLYRLIVGSRLPAAQEFETWIFEKVLPTLRKTGSYTCKGSKYELPQTFAEALRMLADSVEAREQLEAQNAQLAAREAENQPKVAFYEAVKKSESTCLVRVLARYLKQNGYDTGQNRLYAWMKNNGYIHKGGRSKNLPTQKSMNAGLFKVKMTEQELPNGDKIVQHTTLVTTKGIQYFVKRLLGKEYDGSITELKAEENNDIDNVQNVTCIEDLTWED